MDGRRSMSRSTDINPLPCLVLEAGLAAYCAFFSQVISLETRMQVRGEGHRLGARTAKRESRECAVVDARMRLWRSF